MAVTAGLLFLSAAGPAVAVSAVILGAYIRYSFPVRPRRTPTVK